MYPFICENLGTQSFQAVCWADFRMTDYSQIQKWWGIVMSAYLLVSLHSQVLNNHPEQGVNKATDQLCLDFQSRKNLLKNLRLVIQPFIFFNFLKSWLRVFPISPLSIVFLILIALMNRKPGAIPDPSESRHLLFSSA
jgi:hypothetical protein